MLRLDIQQLDLLAGRAENHRPWLEGHSAVFSFALIYNEFLAISHDCLGGVRRAEWDLALR
jgi:hypothetical protein